MKWDVFICHASEDKESFVEPLAVSLKDRGLKVWYDNFSLSLGDNLRTSIDIGLAKSRYGIVVLSSAFFRKKWPQYELDGLTQKEPQGGKVILPIWHKLSRKDVIEYSPSLADKIAAHSTVGITQITEEILQVVAPSLTSVQASIENYFDLASIKNFALSNKIFPAVREIALPEINNCLPHSVGAIVLSPNNRRLAYIAASGKKVFAVVDGDFHKEGFKAFSDHTLVFSSNSQRVAYAMLDDDDKSWVIIDGEIFDECYDGIPNHGISFSPDGRRIAYQALRGNEIVVVVDGIEGRPYESTSTPLFSPNSKKLAYFGFRDGDTFLLINGREIKKVEPNHLENFGWTSDSKEFERINPSNLLGGRISLDASRKELAEINRRAGLPEHMGSGKHLVNVVPGTAVKSPNGKRQAYAVFMDSSICVVVNGEYNFKHDALHLGTPIFSPDSKHFAYVAEDYGVWRIVIDWIHSEAAYESPFLDCKPYFLSTKSLNFLAWREDRLYYIETELAKHSFFRSLTHH